MPELYLVEAVNDALHVEMERDADVLVLGEDVGRAGGVFRATAGLRDRFGADRCVDTPLSDPFIASGRDQGGDTFRLEVQDMSLGGVALRTSDVRFAELPKGSVWKNVTLQLGGFGSVTTDLEIVAPREALTPTGERRTVLGCRFVELRDNAERTLQRAITQLEMRRLGRAANA